ncbi:MAG: FMN-binding protein [Clostridia bacterium]|nr:FMN-binding protein [Clostridia bacterium]
MLKAKIMPTVVLGSICLVVALLLSVVNMFTGPIIAKAQAEKANAALAVVLPGGTNFTEIPVEGAGFPESVTAAYKADNGYVFQMTVTGYKPGLVIMCGIDNNGTITGADFIASQETLYAEVGLGAKFVGYDKSTITTDIIAGPTAKLTTQAYYSAIEAALNAFIIAKGGTVDLRDPAQILQDNCNAALGTEGVTFEKWFATASVEGVSALYISDKGAVAVIGETFVGVADGNVVGDAGEAEKTAALAIYDAYKSEKLTEAAKPEGAHKNVDKIYTAENGTVVIEMKAAGYGINGDWHTSGEYITLKVAIDGEGKIISTLTTYENESDNIGDVVAKPDYYEQFNGKTDATYTEVENVAGATYSTDGYRTAIKQAFEAYKLLKGGNEQ